MDDNDELANIPADLPTDLDDFGDDEDVDRFNIENVKDYREHPYELPSLTEQQNKKVAERMRLMTRKESTPTNILIHGKNLMTACCPQKNSSTVRLQKVVFRIEITVALKRYLSLWR